MFKGIEFDKEEESEFRLHVLAENLKNIRDHFDLSQENLAEVTHVSVNEIGKIECEKVKPGFTVLVSLAKGLGLGIDTLLTPDLDVSNLSPP